MKIIIDAMGGDHAPDQIVLGAMQAAKRFGVQIVLVGRGVEILAAMKQHGVDTLPDGLEIANAEDVVDMHVDPTKVVQQHRNSSMIVGLKMLAEGGGDAFISAGNSGALLTGATLVTKRIRGIRRAAFAPILPVGGGAILVDAGANIECTPELLLQFGCMGSCYAEKALGRERPRVALLNNGAEEGKGDLLHQEAYTLLSQADARGVIHFIGNIEGRDVSDGGADVVVADGFSGNILLKTMEGTAIYMSKLIKKAFMKNLLTRIGYLFTRRGITEMKTAMDYREVGGSIVIGITKPVIKAHGSSDALAVCGAVRQAIRAVESGFCDAIRANVGAMSLLREAANAE